MKLKWKMMLLILAVTLAAFGLGGALAVGRMRDYTLSLMAESEREKLDAIGRAFRQVGTREEYDAMGETARDAYLKYQFERCYRQGYGLLKDGVCISNLTEYEIVNPAALEGEYMLQEIGGKHVFLLKQPLEYPEGFEVLAVRDISDVWGMLRRQTAFFAAVFFCISLAAALLAAVLAGRLLAGLETLREAAAAVGRGELGRTVDVRGRDEIGQVSEAFNRMSRQVEGQVEDLQLLLGALAHEMKTPVTSIVGYADTLLHVKLSGEQGARCAEQIYMAGKRMEQMSSKLLNLIGMYENDAVVTEELEGVRLFSRIEEENKDFFRERGVTLAISCPESLFFRGDEELFFSLFSNLIQNACKASRPGASVEVSAQEGQVRVRDWGCGIPEKDLPHVKKAFYMADKSRSRREGGSGLGLALAERIAGLYGGSIEIESEVGKGTQVTVHFPKAYCFTKCLPSDEDFRTPFCYSQIVEPGRGGASRKTEGASREER